MVKSEAFVSTVSGMFSQIVYIAAPANPSFKDWNVSTWGLGSEETLLQNSTLLFRQRTESLGLLALVDLVMALDNAVQVSMNYAKFCNQVGPFSQPRIHKNKDIVQ